MKWSKKTGEIIPGKKAKEMIEKHKSIRPDGVQSVYFGADMIQQLLDKKGCVGISIAFAKTDKNDDTVVLRPVDEDGNIIDNEGDSAQALEVGSPCPPYCPK